METNPKTARRAMTLVFVLTGMVFASWAARIPAIKEELGLSAGELGLAVLGLEAGAVAGLPLGGALVARRGSRWALRAGFALYPPMLPAVALAPGLAALTLALALLALTNSVVDVAMNAQGVELERRLGRPVLSGLHAGHSFGLVAAAILATALAAAGVSVTLHFVLVGAFGLAAGQAILGRLLESREPRVQRKPTRRRPARGVLGALAFCAFLIDGVAYNWSATHLRDVHDARPALAAATFLIFALSLACGRLAGDALVRRMGRLAVVRACGLAALVATGLVVSAPGPAVAIAGWALLGGAIAPLAPALLGATADRGGAGTATAIAGVTTLGYLGSFSGSPAVGGLAELVGLSLALALLGAAAAVVVLGAPRALRRPS